MVVALHNLTPKQWEELGAPELSAMLLAARSEANAFGPPPQALAPRAWLQERLELTNPKDSDLQALSRLMLGYTSAFENACCKPLVRRENATLIFSASDIDRDHVPGSGVLWPYNAWPIESISAVHVDQSALDPIDVVFDGTTQLAATDYKMLPAPHGTYSPILFRRTACPTRGSQNIQVTLTFGYSVPDATGDIPENSWPAPPALMEALAQQCAIAWRRRSHSHIGSKSESTPGGGSATTQYWSMRFSKSVRDLLIPYATADGAFILGQTDVPTGGQIG